MNKYRQHLGKQQGFTLLEATVSLLVLSIGMLGIAALFFDGLKSGRTAVYRTTAIYLVSDMADRIRANPAGGAAYGQAGQDNGCEAPDATCTPLEMAQEDVVFWSTEVTAFMPPGTESDLDVEVGLVTTVYTISITWPEAGYDEPMNYSIELEM